MIWLLRRLQPDDKSIAEFRQNGGAITETCAELVGWARSVGLVRGEWVGAIDGSTASALTAAKRLSVAAVS